MCASLQSSVIFLHTLVQSQLVWLPTFGFGLAMLSLTSRLGPFRALKCVSKTICVQAFAALGGKHVGQLYFNKPSESNFVETIKDLQRQAARLLPHPKLGSNYMVLVLDKTKLQILTYRSDMTQEQKSCMLLMLRCLQSANQNSTIRISWDEEGYAALQMIVLNYNLHVIPCRYYSSFGLR